MRHGDSDKDQKRHHDRSAPMITNRFCWICCFARCLALVANSGKAAVLAGDWHAVDKFTSVWLLHDSDVAVLAVSVGRVTFHLLLAEPQRDRSQDWTIDLLRLGNCQ